MPHSCKGAFCLLAHLQSLIRCLLLLHLKGICRWTSQLLLRGSFSKRSTGRWVNGSTGQTGQRVTFTFTILYMIADDTRLTPPCFKKHMGSTGRRVNGSTGQRVKRVDGSTAHFRFHYVIYDSRRRHPAAKSTQRIMTPGSRHTAAKSTQHLLLARRVNFLVFQKTTSHSPTQRPLSAHHCVLGGQSSHVRSRRRGLATSVSMFQGWVCYCRTCSSCSQVPNEGRNSAQNRPINKSLHEWI